MFEVLFRVNIIFHATSDEVFFFFFFFFFCVCFFFFFFFFFSDEDNTIEVDFQNLQFCTMTRSSQEKGNIFTFKRVCNTK